MVKLEFLSSLVYFKNFYPFVYVIVLLIKFSFSYKCVFGFYISALVNVVLAGCLIKMDKVIKMSVWRDIQSMF